MNINDLPNDWVLTKLSEISNMKSGMTITSKDISVSDKYPCYGGNGLRGFTHGFTHNWNFCPNRETKEHYVVMFN